MPVNSTHADYDAALPGWIRARDLLAGEDAVKAAGAKYLPRLEAQSGEEFAAYLARAWFFNATRRAADAFAGLIFRKAPFVRIPEDGRSKMGDGERKSLLTSSPTMNADHPAARLESAGAVK
jgi:hypothetical protein